MKAAQQISMALNGKGAFSVLTEPAPARAYLPELLNEVLAGRLNPSPILDLSVSLDEIASGYAAMDQRRAIKVIVRP